MATAVLDVGKGAALYGISAAAQWEIAGFVHSRRHPVHVLRPERSRRVESDVAVVHTTARAVDRSLRVLRDIPVTSPTQTILDLARHIGAPRLRAVVDRAVQKRIVSESQLNDALTEIARSGRDGVVVLRKVLEERSGGNVPNESNLETRFEFVIERAGLHRFRRQVVVGGDAPIGRVDYLHADVPLIVEINSEAYHSALVDAQADEIRYSKLAEAGFAVVPVWDTDLWFHPDRVVASIERAVHMLMTHAA